MRKKAWWKSRTINFNLILTMYGAVETQFNLMQSLLGKWYGMAFIVCGLVGMYLRSKTNQPIASKDPKPPVINNVNKP